MMKLRSLAAGLLLAVLSLVPVFAQGVGQLGSGQMFANTTAGVARAAPTGASAYFDFVYGSTRGAILERGASGWTAIPPNATAGLPFVSNGTGADPGYGQVALAGLPTLGANTALGSIAGGTPIALSKTQLTTLINSFTSTTSGAAAATGTPTGKFLRDDNTWQAVAGSGTVTNVATAGLATGGPITTTGTVTVTAAVKSDQTTATSTTVAVVPAIQQNHPSAAKAWGYYSQSAGTYTLQSAYGATAAKTATGQITITASTAFTGANFICMVTTDTAGIVANAFPPSTTTCSLRMKNSAGTDTDSGFNFVLFGTQ